MRCLEEITLIHPDESLGIHIVHVCLDNLGDESLGIVLRNNLGDDDRFPVDENAIDDIPKPHCFSIVLDESIKTSVHQSESIHKLMRVPNHIHVLFLHPHVFVWLICLLPLTQTLLVEAPNNTALWVSGSSGVMSCKSDHPAPLRWYVKKDSNSEKEDLYNGYYLNPDAKSYCTVKADKPGECQLLLKNTVETAQTYICFEPRTLAEASADLIWIGGNLTCEDSSTESIISLTCSIEFRGNWAPVMEWKKHNNHDEKVLSIGINTTTVPNQRVTSTLSMPLPKGKRNYTCRAKFDISGKPQETTATNVPIYEQHWLYSVRTKSHDRQGSRLHHRNEVAATFVLSGTERIVAHVMVKIIIATHGILFFIRVLHMQKRENKKKMEQQLNQGLYQEAKLLTNHQRTLTAVQPLKNDGSAVA